MIVFAIAQAISPADAQGWSETVEKGGIIGLLILIILVNCLALMRKWLVLGWVFEEKAAMCRELKEEIKELKRENKDLELIVYRSVRVAETNNQITKQVLSQ